MAVETENKGKENLSVNNLIEGEDYYVNEQGYKVFTEKYHLKRGYCCQNGCKHCPYGFNLKRNKSRNE